MLRGPRRGAALVKLRCLAPLLKGEAEEDVLLLAQLVANVDHRSLRGRRRVLLWLTLHGEEPPVEEVLPLDDASAVDVKHAERGVQRVVIEPLPLLLQIVHQSLEVIKPQLVIVVLVILLIDLADLTLLLLRELFH